MATRWVVVDDTDSGIQYTPASSWFPANGQNENLGNLGPPFLSTSHGLGNGNGSLTYTFTGTAVSVFGTNNEKTSSPSPSWECFVDNVNIGSWPAYAFSENNWPFCEADSLADAQHTITLRATVSGQILWFDRIMYSPSSSANLDLSLVRIDAGDPAVTYGPGWQDMKDSVKTDIGKMTLQQGANATVDFSGTSLKWFSYIPTDSSPASATYSVDGGTPITFKLSGLAANATEQYNQLFFEASGLNPGQHRIELVHGGNNQTTPLSLVYVVVQNAPASAGSTASTSSAGFSSTPTPNSLGANGSNSSSAEHKGATTGGIAGGTLGGVVVLVAVILFLLLLRRRRKRNDLDVDLNQEMSLLNIIDPFSTPPSSPILFPTSGQSSTYSPMLGGPTPWGKSEHVRQDASQSTIPPGPWPPRSHNLGYSFSEASGSLAFATQGSTPGDPRSTNLLSAQSDILVASTTQSPSDIAPQGVIRHEDSGVRLPPRESMLELPPLYTPS